MVVTEETGWQGVESRAARGRGQERRGQKVEVGETVSVDQFEKAVASKYKDSMLGFQTEFMVSPHSTCDAVRSVLTACKSAFVSEEPCNSGRYCSVELC